MKLNEKTVLSSVALAIAAVAVLWYMTIALGQYPENENFAENENLPEGEESEQSGSGDTPIFEDIERAEELPLNVRPEEPAGSDIIPSL